MSADELAQEEPLTFDPSEFEHRVALERRHYWHRHRKQVLLEALQRVSGARSAADPRGAARLVEVGCGIGTVATHLNLAGYQVDYAELHREGLELAQAEAEAQLGAAAKARRFFELDIQSAELPSGYDGALMFDVLEHLPDDVRALSHLRAGLTGAHSSRARRSSFVLLTVPAFQLLWSPWDEVEHHQRRYTRAQLTSVARAAGFELERATYFFAPLFFAALSVKGLRAARAALLGAPPPAKMPELLEARDLPLVNQLALRVLQPERRWLRSRSLPLGTSLLAVLRPR
ncbi:MAG: methyltransferase domain-containing protein [Polyangiaceae bacterium]|nr:methyltransferase domain-containing protein [Polyangiaceae bacterium]MCW5790567.1 methyltransferase domain-containing protein [Polyangiaceae bacterium]